MATSRYDRSPRLDRSVRRVTVVSGDGDRSGVGRTVQLHVRRERRRRRRKVSRELRPEERLVRRMVRAFEVGAREYLRRHDRSTRRRRDGWLDNMDRNLERAHEKMLDELIPD